MQPSSQGESFPEILKPALVRWIPVGFLVGAIGWPAGWDWLVALPLLSLIIVGIAATASLVSTRVPTVPETALLVADPFLMTAVLVAGANRGLGTSAGFATSMGI